MKKSILLISIFLLCLVFAQAEQLSKIAVVDINKVLSFYAGDKQAWKKLEQDINNLDQELEKMKLEIENLEKARLAALQDDNQTKALQYQKEIENKKELQKSYYKVMMDQIERKRNDLFRNSDALDKISRQITHIAESEGYTLVIDVNAKSYGVFWWSPTIDITPKLLAELGLQ
ncbi:MAG: OmpH family outer membrane protein [Spirochaetales bacterium]|nr:OmpH family outer membrane protein [Spirochaetales bacterium]